MKDSPISLVAQTVKHLPEMQETQVQSLGWEDPLEKEMATHSSILAWKIPWTEESGRLQSMESERVGYNWATSLSFSPISQYRVVIWSKLKKISFICHRWDAWGEKTKIRFQQFWRSKEKTHFLGYHCLIIRGGGLCK